MIPIFVGGTGRSGTTIALELLGQHSKFYASNPLEVRIVTDPDGLLDSLEKNNIENFNSKVDNLWFNRTKQNEGLYYSINQDTLKKTLEKFNTSFFEDPTSATKTFYYNIFKNQNSFKNNADYFGDSTPSNIRYAHRINNIFPDAKFIHMFRDGRDAAFSMYLMREYFDLAGNKTEFDALDWWYERIVQSFMSLNSLKINQYISVRLEDLVINKREESFLSLLNFLNLEEEKEIRNYFNININTGSMSIGQWKNLYTWKDFDNKYNEMLLKLKEQNIYIEKYY